MCVWKCRVGTFLEDLLYTYNLYSTWCTVLDFIKEYGLEAFLYCMT